MIRRMFLRGTEPSPGAQKRVAAGSRRRGWRRLGYVGLVVLGCLVSGSGRADPPATAEAVVELRLAVAALAAELQASRAQTQSTLAALHSEKEQLERELRLARLRSATLDRVERERADQQAAQQAEATQWRDPAKAALGTVRAYVDRALPFSTAEREATLDRIEAELAGHRPDVARAMEHLWRFVEEEAGMTGEIGLHRQSIALDGSSEPQLVEVLRIGMAVLYFRMATGAVGWARYDDGWRFEVLEDPTLASSIRALFEAHEGNEIYGPVLLVVPAILESAGPE